MRPILVREQIRSLERDLIEAGVPGIVLMENAGRGAAHLIGLAARPRHEGVPAAPHRERLLGGSCVRCADERSLDGVGVVVVSGRGNNGGDGFVVARHLLGRGAKVETLLVGEPERIRGDARIALGALAAVGGAPRALELRGLDALLSQADVVVDALLGTGLEGEVSGAHIEVIDSLVGCERPVFALDLPSGLDCDTGRPLGRAVRAVHTVTFGHFKAGLFTTSGYEHAGRVTLSHIGVPATLPAGLEPAAWLLEESDVRAELAPRAVGVHKVAAGRVVLVAGSPGTVGAARLAALGALRGGVGLVTAAASSATIARLESEVLELMTAAVDDWSQHSERELLALADVLVVGPGLGRDDGARQSVEAALEAHRPTVLDADGLRALEGHLERVRGHGRLVLTPHVGEAAGLLGRRAADIEADRFAALAELTRRSGAVVVLKGPRTLIGAPGRTPVVSVFGTPALATGGSGDVLSGIVAAELARRPSQLFEAAWTAVALHGLAAESWSTRHGDAGLLASEVADALPALRARLLGD